MIRSLRNTIVIVLFVSSLAFAQRDLKNIPDPDPELERQTFIVPDGFEVNLWAADPKMAKPIHMNFDERGRLWVASSEIYPHIKPGQAANDKVLVLQDADGDGKAEQASVFADGLLIPTGIAPGDGGVYVVNSTELLHFQDTNGDGRADRRRVVLSGFGTEDTHHLLHTLRWGHDGCLYMNQSIYIHSHVETPYGVKRLNGGGVWRFRPETLELDVVCRGFVNSWGHHFDHWGTNFCTDGAYGDGINYMFPGAVYVTAVGAKRTLTGLNPGSPKHCGLEITSGRHLPDDWNGSMLTNDFRAHRVCRFVVTEDGSGFSSRQEVEVIKSNHVAFRPIDVKMGPDGAIYIADWYNPIIQHGEVDFRDPRRDHVHGRIWRVTAKNRPLLKTTNLAAASTAELLDALRAPEEWTRLHGKLQLKSRGPEVLAAVDNWRTKIAPSSADFEHAQLEALWVYQSLNVVHEPLLAERLRSSDHRVRAAALRVASLWTARLKSPLDYFAAGVADPHPRVRLEAVRALANVPSLEAARLAATALDRPMDRFLDFAVWQTMRDLEPVWLPALREGKFDFAGNLSHLSFALKAVEASGAVQPLVTLIQANKVPAERLSDTLALIATLGNAADLGAVLNITLDEKSSLAAATKAIIVHALAETSAQRKVNPSGDLNRIARLFSDADESLRGAALRAAGAWKLEAQRGTLTKLASGDGATSIVTRTRAIESLAALGGPESVATLKELAGPKQEPAVRKQAVVSLAPLHLRDATRLGAALLAELSLADSPADIVAPLLAQKGGAADLTAALTNQPLSTDVAKLTLRAAQSAAASSPELLDAIRKAGKLAAAAWKLNPQLLSELVGEVATKGNAARGEAIYQRKQMQCVKCHAIGGAGGRVGPDLVSIGASAPVDYLVEALLDPNKKIKENYHSLIIETDAGKVITGIPIRESKTELVLRDAEDREIKIAPATIELRRDGRSLMPDGAANELTRGEVVDLVRFLSELGKVGPYAIGSTRVVRRWETLTWTKEAHQRLNRSSYDTVASGDAALTFEPAYSQVSGDLIATDLPSFIIHKGNPPTTFVRFQVDVTTGGDVRLSIPNTQGLSLWLDKKPTPIQSTVTTPWQPGVHTVTLAIDQAARREPLRVELTDAPGSSAKAQLVSGK